MLRLYREGGSGLPATFGAVFKGKKDIFGQKKRTKKDIFGQKRTKKGQNSIEQRHRVYNYRNFDIMIDSP